MVSRPLETVFDGLGLGIDTAGLGLGLGIAGLGLGLGLEGLVSSIFVTSHVAKMPTGASSRTAAEHILSAHLTATL